MMRRSTEGKISAMVRSGNSRSASSALRADDAVAMAGAAALASFSASPLIRRLLVDRNVWDRPNDRSSHGAPVPRGGGWACLAGTVAGQLVARACGHPVSPATLAGVTILALVGFADDVRGLPPAPRLAAQMGVGLANGLLSGRPVLGTFLTPITVNVVNFMDGIDGITALTTAVWGVNAAVIGLTTGHAYLVVSGSTAAGSALGFLPHNLRRHRMFLGDIGSYFIGATMALTTLQPGISRSVRVALLAPLAPSLADTGCTLAVRALRGERLMQAHREHVYQRLANEKGVGHVQTALLYAAAATGCALVAGRALRLTDRFGPRRRRWVRS